MSEFRPVTTAEDLDRLDETEMVAGYLSGLHGEPEPGNTRTRSFWHGWRNGMADSGRREPDAAQGALAHALVARGDLFRQQGAMQ